MSLDAGGHLTHGFRPNISGKMFHQQQYGTDPESGLLDYDAVRAKAREFKPLVLVAGYSAYPRRVNFATMREIADEVGAVLMVDMAHFAGLVAGKVFTGDEDPVAHAHVVTSTTHKSLRGPRGGIVLATEEFAADVDRGCPMVLGGPLSHVMAAKAVAFAEARQPEFATYAQHIADNAKSLAEGFLTRDNTLVTGGTDNHLVLLDVASYGLTGRQAESALLEAGVVTNRNSVPRDPNGAWYTTGVRLGTPALTTRGFGHDDFDTVAELIVDVLSNTQPGTTKSGGASKASYVLADGGRRAHPRPDRRDARATPALPGPRPGLTPRRRQCTPDRCRGVARARPRVRSRRLSASPDCVRDASAPRPTAFATPQRLARLRSRRLGAAVAATMLSAPGPAARPCPRRPRPGAPGARSPRARRRRARPPRPGRWPGATTPRPRRSPDRRRAAPDRQASAWSASCGTKVCGRPLQAVSRATT